MLQKMEINPSYSFCSRIISGEMESAVQYIKLGSKELYCGVEDDRISISMSKRKKGGDLKRMKQAESKIWDHYIIRSKRAHKLMK